MPLTDDELAKLYEEAGLDVKVYLAKRNATEAKQKQYYIDHVACPICGNDRHSTTYMGYIVTNHDQDTFKDENNVQCSRCGWKGITHDLVRKQE